MKSLFPVALAALALANVGCSGIYAYRGTKIYDRFVPSSARQDVRDRFTSVDLSICFDHPKPASTIPQIRKVLDRYKNTQVDMNIWGYEEYTFKGWIYSPAEWAGEGMVEALTLGIALLPMSVTNAKKAKAQKRRLHRFRVWYDSEEHYYGFQKIEDSFYDGYYPEVKAQLREFRFLPYY